MRSSQTLGAHLHCVCQYIGGISLQNHEINNPGVTREPAMPAICKTETTTFT